jgi:L-2-hydroxyglutarate oxidase
MMIYDFCVVGGGIVGLSSALHILESNPKASLLLLEKESQPAGHQTSHNSGVVHAGVYYQPGSLKAKLCKEGLKSTLDFCKDYKIPIKQCGKLIVATDRGEEVRLKELYARSIKNGLKTTIVGANELHSIEPNIEGVAAILVHETAIVDYKLIALKMLNLIKSFGAEVLFNSEVERISEKADYVEVSLDNQIIKTKKLVACAGLQSDRIARVSGLNVDFKIIPFRGEYYQLPKSKNNIVNHLIYPTPDPRLPFLGIHLTKMIDGSVTVGPNAVIGFSREDYNKFSFDFKDTSSMLTYGGFWKLLWNYRNHAAKELRSSISKNHYLKNCQKYCPSLNYSDLKPFRSGIRAQAVTAKGQAVHDFLFVETDRMMHVLNAPSPAATSAIPIGKMIAKRCSGNFNLKDYK